ncbi:hypothetical protein D3C72_978580 [compost metagenome]
MAEAGHVEQILNVAIEALGFIAGAFEQFTTIFQRDRFAEGQQAVDAAAHGRQRRAQIVGYGGQQGTAQLFGFTVQARGFQVISQLRARQRLGERLTQCGEQAPTLATQGLAFFGADTEQRQRPVLDRQRPPPPASERQRASAHACRLIVLPGPVSGGAFGLGKLQRPAGLDLPAALPVPVEQT